MRRVYRELYNWEIDFPISLQDSKPNGKSTFRLEFDLTGREVEEFRRDIKSNLNGTLPIELRIGQREKPTFKVLKRGPGGPALSGKANRIARYLGSRIDFNYIPTIRTAEAASEVVARMVGRRLAALEHDDSYKTAIEKIRELQEPILKQLSNEVTETLRQFLPEVHSVSVEVSERTRIRSYRRDCEITVDDGTATLLERKGDGVKSLAAISLLYGSSPTESASILALEEPESHLHPKAIHKLREVLDDLSSNVQLVITTHNPLFVDRTQLKNNVLVSDRRAKSARSVAEVRELLGVRAADNLAHARFVLVVEGRGDRDCVGALFRARSKSVTAALDSNDLVIDTLAGAGKLNYKLSLLQAALCVVHVFLDNDDSGRDAYHSALNEGLVNDADCQFASCLGMSNSEIEDCIRVDLYAHMLQKYFGVNVDVREFRSAKKWSERMRQTFMPQGRAWNDSVKARVKTKVSELVTSSPSDALDENKGTSVLALIEAVEAKVNAFES